MSFEITVDSIKEKFEEASTKADISNFPSLTVGMNCGNIVLPVDGCEVRASFAQTSRVHLG